MIEIDGSYMEGGGQIIRTALGLSALTKQAFVVNNIRSGRPMPGLRNQHLSCVKAVGQLCKAFVEGANLGSTSLTFIPRELNGKTISIDIGTAGSICLLLQAILLPAIFSPKQFRIKIVGGTNVPFAPTSTYITQVLLPHLRKFTEKLSYSILKEGFVPEGGGIAELFVKPKFSLSSYDNFSEFKAALNNVSTKVNLESQGKLLQIKGSSIASSDLQKSQVAERQANAAALFFGNLSIPIRIDSNYCDSFSVGSAITLWSTHSDSDEVSQINPIILGACSLGERSVKAEDVGMKAANLLSQQINSNAPVDKHLADQLLPYVALTAGKITASEITPHCLTNIYTIEKFLGKCFEVDEKNKIILARC